MSGASVSTMLGVAVFASLVAAALAGDRVLDNVTSLRKFVAAGPPSIIRFGFALAEDQESVVWEQVSEGLASLPNLQVARVPVAYLTDPEGSTDTEGGRVLRELGIEMFDLPHIMYFPHGGCRFERIRPRGPSARDLIRAIRLATALPVPLPGSSKALNNITKVAWTTDLTDSSLQQLAADAHALAEEMEAERERRQQLEAAEAGLGPKERVEAILERLEGADPAVVAEELERHSELLDEVLRAEMSEGEAGEAAGAFTPETEDAALLRIEEELQSADPERRLREQSLQRVSLAPKPRPSVAHQLSQLLSDAASSGSDPRTALQQTVQARLRRLQAQASRGTMRSEEEAEDIEQELDLLSSFATKPAKCAPGSRVVV